MVKGPASFDQGLFLMHLHKGKEYFEQNQFQKAREELEAAYHLRPQDEKVLNMLGMTYFKLEMLPQAEEMYTALTANNPDVYTLQSNLGLIRLKLDKLEKAEDSLNRALELQPSNPKAHFYLGLLYEKMDKLDKALFHFEQAHADKMIQKVKQKLEEAKSKEYTLLPFTVVEVLDGEPSIPIQTEAMFQTSVAPLPVAEPTPIHQEEKLQIKDEEIAAAAAESEWVEGGSSTGKMRRRDVMEAIDQKEEEEELVEDADSEEGLVEEESSIEEETRPPMNVSESELHDDVRSDDAPGGINSTAASLFIPDEMAADISQFLAQSRDEEPATEENFVAEPPGNGAAVEENHVLVDAVESPFEEPPEELSKIPTPEEVENAVAEMEKKDDQPVDEPRETPPAKEPPAERPPYEEPPTDEVPVEEPVEEPPIREPQEEIATSDPFGPDVINASVEKSFAAAIRPDPHSDRTIEHTISMDAVEHAAHPTKTQELYQPANLDQFSRDRYYVQPLIGADRFLLIDPHLLEIIISDRLIVRKGTISSFTGNLSFEPWHKDENNLPLIQVSGAGILFLAERRQDIYLISLNNETLFVESNHILVVQSALKVEPHFFLKTPSDDNFAMVKVSGRGTLALTCHSKPLTLNVYDAMPANIPADALIAWSGRLTCDILTDPDLNKIMMSGEGTILLRFTGSGDVVVEQGSLWGERRTKK
ncbi:tetratricopeptide repeat protein [bacterium]|nr:tetratricopeptide repeat protein [bacterium]